MSGNNKYAIINGRVIDPANGIDKITDVYVLDKNIERIGGRKTYSDRVVIDASGMIVMPGLVDIHVHLREPGDEDAETVESGAKSAVRGGITTVCCMPNTNPTTDTMEGVRFIYDRARTAECWVYPIAAISKGLKGEELTEMHDLAKAGAIGFSDDGRPVSNARLLRNAMTYSKMVGLPLALHCEDENLMKNGHMHEGVVSGLLGMPGIPAISESVMVARDITLAEYTYSCVHFCHISTRSSVDCIRSAKKRGLAITAEATPHHLLLTDEAVANSGCNADFKMNPPLRSSEDMLALREALADGTIDAIASDHAPHPPQDKDRDFISAPFGVIGLETSASLIYSELVRKGIIDEVRMVELMSTRPARIFDLPGGTLTQGSFADIAILDPNRKWKVDPQSFASLSRNTPFAGWELTGKIVWTMVAGEVVHNELKRQ